MSRSLCRAATSKNFLGELPRTPYTGSWFPRIDALGRWVNKAGARYSSEFSAKSAVVFSTPTMMKYKAVATNEPSGQPGKLGA